MRAFAWLVVGGVIVAGCVAGAPSSPPAPSGDPTLPMFAQQGEGLGPYFLPSSVTMRAVYRITMATTLPGSLASQSTSSAGTSTVEVVALSGNRAELRQSDRLDGTSETSVSTSSVVVNPDGSVTLQTDGEPMRYPVAAFSAAGADLVPASGPIPAWRARLVGNESIAVPAGRFDAVRIEEGMLGHEQHQSWYAAGVGLVQQRMQATFSVPLSDNQLGEGRSTLESVLQEFRR